MILKKFQTKAVTKLLNYSLELINEEANKKIIFRSPTGSGKTIVIAEFINRFVSSKINNSSILIQNIQNVTPFKKFMDHFPINYQLLNSFYKQKRDFFTALIKDSRFEILPSAGTYFQLLSYNH